MPPPCPIMRGMGSITIRKCDDLPYGPGQSDYEYDNARQRKDDMANDNAVVTVEPSPQAVTPMAMLQLAVEKGASVEQLERLMALQERYEANEAKKEFVAAMTRFKESPAIIEKKKLVDFPNSKGGRTTYKHATLATVCDAIGPALSAVGISHRWETEQLEGGQIKVTCILTHARGHSEKVWLQAGRDESGGKNNIQAVGSTVTYLQRYTLLAATGMAVQDQRDDDGAGGAGVHEMTGEAKAAYLERIAALADVKHAESLWQTIATECTKIGDIPAYNELKAAVAAKVKALKAAPKGGEI